VAEEYWWATTQAAGRDAAADKFGFKQPFLLHTYEYSNSHLVSRIFFSENRQ
jgi:hypothetical protein